MIRCRIIAISKRKITGIDTRKSERGSGGEKIAPMTKAANQMCFRYAANVFGSTIPTRKASNVMTGA